MFDLLASTSYNPNRIMVNRNESPVYKEYKDWAKDPNVRRNINIILLVGAIIVGAIGWNYFAESAQQRQTERKGSNIPSLVEKI